MFTDVTESEQEQWTEGELNRRLNSHQHCFFSKGKTTANIVKAVSQNRASHMRITTAFKIDKIISFFLESGHKGARTERDPNGKVMSHATLICLLMIKFYLWFIPQGLSSHCVSFWVCVTNCLLTRPFLQNRKSQWDTVITWYWCEWSKTAKSPITKPKRSDFTFYFCFLNPKNACVQN